MGAMKLKSKQFRDITKE